MNKRNKLTTVSVKITFFFLICFPFLLFTQQEASYQIIENKSDLKILTPSLKDVKVGKIRLENGLEALLVSDPNTHKSAAALSVNVGMWEDPKEHSGMAHFLEHMLFLGTEKYPKEGDFQAFVGDSGGSTNASTGPTYTVYEFEINNSSFEEGLDRFAQFFIHPLFNPSGVNREMHAVNQELAFRAENDQLRLYTVSLALSNQNHPNSTFGCGNLETLSEITQNELKTWYKAHYSANIMKLVVYSNLPMEDLTRRVVEDFSDIKNHNIQIPSWPMPLTDEKYDGSIAYIQPVKNLRQLDLSWEITSDFANDLETHIPSFVAFLLSDQGPGSLYEILKKEGLIDSLEADSESLGLHHAVFEIQIGLTEKGLKERNKVIEKVFQMITLLKGKTFPKYLFNEVNSMAKLNYEYQSQKDPFSFVRSTALQLIKEDLATYPQHILIADKYDPNKAEKLLEELTPQKCLFSLLADPKLTGEIPDKSEKWTSAQYTVKPVDAELLDHWKDAKPTASMKMPTPNPYIPKGLTIVSDSFKNPNISLELEPLSQTLENVFYYALDQSYLVPKVYYKIYLNSSKFQPDPKSNALISLYLDSVSDKLTPMTFQASVGGLNYSLSWNLDLGISLNVYGYTPKASLFLSEIIKELKSIRPTKEEFANSKDVILRSYQNELKEAPFRQAIQTSQDLIYRYKYPADLKVDAVNAIEYEELLAFIEKIYDEIYIRGLFYGNLTREDAEKVMDKTNTAFTGAKTYPIQAQPKQEVLDLKAQTEPLYIFRDIQMEGNATLLAISDGPFSFKDRAAQQILQQTVNDPFYNTLRTKQQTGYVVASFDKEQEGQLFSYFLVQSSTYDPRDLLSRFELFLEEFLVELRSNPNSENQFNEIKKAQLSILQEPPRSLLEMGTRLDLLAFQYNADFKWFDKRIEAMKDLSFEDILQFSNEYFGRNNSMRLAVLLEGTYAKNQQYFYEPIQSYSSFKKKSLYETRPKEFRLMQ